MRRGTAVPSVRLAGRKAMHPCFPEKCDDTDMPPVPKPTQVGGYKDTKARERNLVKELGNIAPFTAPPGIALEDPFFRSYGVSVPSSLTRFLSRALVSLYHSTCVGFGTDEQAATTGLFLAA